MPCGVLLMIASFEDWTIAASQAAESPPGPIGRGSFVITNPSLCQAVLALRATITEARTAGPSVSEPRASDKGRSVAAALR